MKQIFILSAFFVLHCAYAQKANEIGSSNSHAQYATTQAILLTHTANSAFAPDTFLTQRTKALKRAQERREHDARRHEPREHDPRMSGQRRDDERRINREAYIMSGKYSRKSAIQLLVLGSVKIAVGAACLTGFAAQDDGLFSIGFPILGGFHILTGAAMLAPGVILFNKSKRQAAAYGGRTYLSFPSLYTSYPNQGGGLAIGLHTSVMF